MTVYRMELDTTVIDWVGLGLDPQIIVENSKRIKGRFIPAEELKDEPCAVVGYGPSLKDTWQEIRNFKTVFTCSGSHKFLIDRGIVPTYHCESDPRPHKVAMLGEPHPDVVYLMASICHSNYFDKLEWAGADIRLWHILFQEDELFGLVEPGEWLLCGGNAIGPRTIKIARLSGFTDIHLFGLDGSGAHAGKHTNEPPDDRFFDYNCEGRFFRVTDQLLYQALVLFQDLDRMSDVKVTWHGDGLQQHMAKFRKHEKLKRRPIAVQK